MPDRCREEGGRERRRDWREQRTDQSHDAEPWGYWAVTCNHLCLPWDRWECTSSGLCFLPVFLYRPSSFFFFKASLCLGKLVSRVGVNSYSYLPRYQPSNRLPPTHSWSLQLRGQQSREISSVLSAPQHSMQCSGSCSACCAPAIRSSLSRDKAWLAFKSEAGT